MVTKLFGGLPEKSNTLPGVGHTPASHGLPWGRGVFLDTSRQGKGEH